MGLTPTYGLPYPDLDDPPNGPSQIAALANAMEYQLGLLSTALTAATETANAALALATTAAGTEWDVWTPTFTGLGSGVMSAGGRWRRTGKKTVLCTVQWSVTTAGTGSANVTFTLPTAPSRARRWTFVGGNEAGIGRSGLYAETFTGGTGTTVDRIRFAGNTSLVGSMLEGTQIYHFSGEYEEA